MASMIQITEKDNVAVAVAPVAAGEEIICGAGRIRVAQDVASGHKIALREISAGEDIIKYGFVIGHASAVIRPGEWVHTHNMATNLATETEYRYQPDVPVMPTVEPETFRGFRRRDGRAGIRNEVWIIPTVGCVNDVAKKLEADCQDLVKGSVEGLYAFTHPFGCSQTGEDHAQTRRLLASLVQHPNAASVLVIGLGCENLTHEQFVEELGDYDPERVRFLICQEVEDELEEGRALLRQCAEYAGSFRRQDIPVSELVVGLKCGGSDGLSGITANPAVGRFSDMLVARGGSTVLTEVPEMFGAEGMLLNRCRDEEVFRKAVEMINGFKNYFLEHHEVVYENPSPGNRQGGITTLEDKSCGCVQKGGTAPVSDVIGYGERVTTKGLNLLYGPGNDLVSSTALTAAGAHMILFTTGRGTPFGAPAPTIKVASNSPLAERKPGWIDFDAGPVAKGELLEDCARRLLSLVIDTAGGRRTNSENNGYREISIFKDGVVL